MWRLDGEQETDSGTKFSSSPLMGDLAVESLTDSTLQAQQLTKFHELNLYTLISKIALVSSSTCTFFFVVLAFFLPQDGFELSAESRVPDPDFPIPRFHFLF